MLGILGILGIPWNKCVEIIVTISITGNITSIFISINKIFINTY